MQEMLERVDRPGVRVSRGVARSREVATRNRVIQREPVVLAASTARSRKPLCSSLRREAPTRPFRLQNDAGTIEVGCWGVA